MKNHTDGLHHFHTRKRIHQKHETYPHPHKWKRFIDRLIYFVCIIGPIFTIPQLMKIWVDKNTSGLSVVTWSSYWVIAFFWLLYGLTHKEKPIIIANVLWLTMNTFIIGGILMFR